MPTEPPDGAEGTKVAAEGKQPEVRAIETKPPERGASGAVKGSADPKQIIGTVGKRKTAILAANPELRELLKTYRTFEARDKRLLGGMEEEAGDTEEMDTPDMYAQKIKKLARSTIPLYPLFAECAYRDYTERRTHQYIDRVNINNFVAAMEFNLVLAASDIQAHVNNNLTEMKGVAASTILPTSFDLFHKSELDVKHVLTLPSNEQQKICEDCLTRIQQQIKDLAKSLLKTAREPYSRPKLRLQWEMVWSIKDLLQSCLQVLQAPSSGQQVVHTTLQSLSPQQRSKAMAELLNLKKPKPLLIFLLEDLQTFAAQHDLEHLLLLTERYLRRAR